MNMFNVPKKVNRHVLKAMSVLSGGDSRRRVPTKFIIDQVKYQMRDLIPVPRIDKVVQKSLKNLSDCGLIEKSGRNQFSIGESITTPTPQPNSQTTPNRSHFRPGVSRKRSVSTLDPNLNSSRRSHSDDSLSGNEFERARKIMRSNNRTLPRAGNNVNLPKAKHHAAYSLDGGAFGSGYDSNMAYDSTSELNGIRLQSSRKSFSMNNMSNSLGSVDSLPIIDITDSSHNHKASESATKDSVREKQDIKTDTDLKETKTSKTVTAAESEANNSHKSSSSMNRSKPETLHSKSALHSGANNSPEIKTASSARNFLN